MLREAGARPIPDLIAPLIFVVAVTARLAPVLRGGGFFSDGNYDDAVHYAAAAGLVHGRMPYADFLFLHPPGIVVALAPFAAFGTWTSDALGMAAARLAWILLGGINAALVVLILRNIGLTAALSGGLFYAGYLPAVYSEHTTLLEALGTFGILLALYIGRFTDTAASCSPVHVLIAGLWRAQRRASRCGASSRSSPSSSGFWSRPAGAGQDPSSPPPSLVAVLSASPSS